jgi:pyruvate dehydrogenase (quinone)
MTECDTLLMVGSGFPYAEFMPEEGQARGVQIDIEPDMLSLRYPMEVNLVGDAAETLRLLLPLLDRKEDRKWRGEIEKQVADWWKLLGERAMQPAKPVNPQRVVWELSSRLPDNAIVTCDSGSCANWYARDLKMRRGMMASLSGGLASMGAAVPYAIAAKFAHPDRPVVGLVGDGAMQMNNMGRTHHSRQILAWVDRQPLGHVCLQQRGSQPGDLGAAGHGGRFQVQRLAEHPKCSLSSLCRDDWA